LEEQKPCIVCHFFWTDFYLKFHSNPELWAIPYQNRSVKYWTKKHVPGDSIFKCKALFFLAMSLDSHCCFYHGGEERRPSRGSTLCCCRTNLKSQQFSIIWKIPTVIHTMVTNFLIKGSGKLYQCNQLYSSWAK
jgi:hypothetical protein